MTVVMWVRCQRESREILYGTTFGLEVRMFKRVWSLDSHLCRHCDILKTYLLKFKLERYEHIG